MQIEQQNAGIAILTSNKINCKTKTATRDKKVHNITIKESIQ